MRLEYIGRVVKLELDEKKCIGCGMCVTVCPQGVFDRIKKAYIVNKDWCMQCGACAKNCPVAAIKVKSGVG
jgi:ferredoxin